MTEISLTVNGRLVSAEVEPRLHLADFLREKRGLTGTHIGCEHGVCGACTLLLDGMPARSCITYATACGDRSVMTIEGLEDDPVIARLRQAFTAKHALQCGYCTPGMLVTARDIVLRLPDADEDRIRLELAGNLCRCTGYQGIVDAIRSVLDAKLDFARQRPNSPPKIRFGAVTDVELKPEAALRITALQDGDRLSLSLQLAAPPEAVWKAIADPRLVANCVPGASLARVDDGRIEGDLLVSLGPIQGRFSGAATVDYDAAGHTGSVAGEGRDQATGTRLSAQATFAVRPDGDRASTVDFTMSYALRGPLAQFGRGPVVRVFAAEIAGIVGRNLEAALIGGGPFIAETKLNAIGLVFRVVLRRVRALLLDRGSNV